MIEYYLASWFDAICGRRSVGLPTETCQNVVSRQRKSVLNVSLLGYRLEWLLPSVAFRVGWRTLRFLLHLTRLTAAYTGEVKLLDV